MLPSFIFNILLILYKYGYSITRFQTQKGDERMFGYFGYEEVKSVKSLKRGIIKETYENLKKEFKHKDDNFDYIVQIYFLDCNEKILVFVYLKDSQEQEVVNRDQFTKVFEDRLEYYFNLDF